MQLVGREVEVVKFLNCLQISSWIGKSTLWRETEQQVNELQALSCFNKVYSLTGMLWNSGLEISRQIKKPYVRKPSVDIELNEITSKE